MSSANIAMLVDMGFSTKKAEKALEVTGNKGVEAAMEWLLAHNDEIESVANPPDAAGATECDNVPAQDDAGSASNEDASQLVAKSMKCTICGKLFKNNLEVEFHVSKTGHNQFSESMEEKKPLTEEEKRQQLKLLEEKLKQKRKEREENEKKEAFEKEKNRIRSGKEMAEARKRLEDLEMKKILEQRRREKEEDRLARQRVKDQIEADKMARKAKAAAANGNYIPVAAATSPVQSQPTVQAAKKEYGETRIQIRLTNGQTIQEKFSSKEQLSAVRLYVELHRTDECGPFNLMTNFPRKVFDENDYDTPLDVLGLVPTAVIIVQKK